MQLWTDGKWSFRWRSINDLPQHTIVSPQHLPQHHCQCCCRMFPWGFYQKLVSGSTLHQHSSASGGCQSSIKFIFYIFYLQGIACRSCLTSYYGCVLFSLHSSPLSPEWSLLMVKLLKVSAQRPYGSLPLNARLTSLISCFKKWLTTHHFCEAFSTLLDIFVCYFVCVYTWCL